MQSVVVSFASQVDARPFIVPMDLKTVFVYGMANYVALTSQPKTYTEIITPAEDGIIGWFILDTFMTIPYTQNILLYRKDTYYLSSAGPARFVLFYNDLSSAE